MTYTVAIIGTGTGPRGDRDSGATARRHARGYRRLDDCELVACAAVDAAGAGTDADPGAVADAVGLDGAFADHETLLGEVDPDVVSVCAPSADHAGVVLDCARFGDVAAVHCAAPLATTWRDCRETVAVCAREAVQLTVDHRRRFARPVTEARRLLDRGEIGAVRRVEWSAPDLFHAGAHLFDLCDYLLDGPRPAWALAGVDPDTEREHRDSSATRAIAQWAYEDGTQGFASTAATGETVVDAALRVVGEDGVVEIAPDDGPPLRIQRDGGWQTVGTGGESIDGPGLTTVEAATNELVDRLPGVSRPADPGPTHTERAIDHLVTALRRGTDPRIAGHRVLRGTGLVFACWAAARRRERVEFPLAVEGNPLDVLCAEKVDGTDDREGPDGDTAPSGSRADTRETREPRTDGDGEPTN